MTGLIERESARAMCDAYLAEIGRLHAENQRLQAVEAENKRLKNELWAKQGSVELRDSEIERLRIALNVIATTFDTPGGTRGLWWYREGQGVARDAPWTVARRALGGDGS